MCEESKKLEPCISLIGMAGAGKSTIGALLAQKLGWAFADSDQILESLYAAPLQSITNAVGKETFLDIECAMILSLRLHRCVLATGGSVVHRPKAMKFLKEIGPIVYIDISYKETLARIALNPDRGIAIAPGESLEDIYNSRKPLYHKDADIICNSEENDPEKCTALIAEMLKQKYGIEN